MKNAALAAIVLAACAGSPSSRPEKEPAMPTDRKQQVVDLLESIESGAPGPVAVIDPDRYTQHNLAVADGLEGFGALLAQLPKGSARVDTVRVFQDGDFVFAHTDYDFFGPKIGFDVFRFENGKIVEHWDNLQEKPGTPNPSGHTMTDGPTDALDLHATAANKQRVAAFVDDILVNGRMDRLAGYIDADNYTQHNPHIADGLAGLGAALEAMAKAGVTMKYERVHRVLGEGNFVLTVSEGQLAGRHTAFYDLFRVEAGKIVEHWDTIETRPPTSEWKNANGKFESSNQKRLEEAPFAEAEGRPARGARRSGGEDSVGLCPMERGRSPRGDL
jgi:predicted SnoaL-like aldol condensation-catalyzing enzyme